jgi:NAD dependent epimerase/dehydratase family
MLEIVAVVVNMNVWTRIKLAEGAMPGPRVERLPQFPCRRGDALPARPGRRSNRALTDSAPGVRSARGSIMNPADRAQATRPHPTPPANRRTEQMQMIVFIAGATGAVGRPLVQQLVSAGHEVIGTTRSAEKQGHLRSAAHRPGPTAAAKADLATG